MHLRMIMSYACMCLCLFAGLYVCVCVCMYVRMSTCMYVCLCACMYVRICAQTAFFIEHLLTSDKVCLHTQDGISQTQQINHCFCNGHFAKHESKIANSQ